VLDLVDVVADNIFIVAGGSCEIILAFFVSESAGVVNVWVRRSVVSGALGIVALLGHAFLPRLFPTGQAADFVGCELPFKLIMLLFLLAGSVLEESFDAFFGNLSGLWCAEMIEPGGDFGFMKHCVLLFLGATGGELLVGECLRCDEVEGLIVKFVDEVSQVRWLLNLALSPLKTKRLAH
jgi:hypothetical protein